MTTAEPDDFDSFYSATARRVLHHVYVVCGDLGDAQDAVQEAYARAWQHWPRLSSYDNPEAVERPRRGGVQCHDPGCGRR
jgi:RNA polymerase sigma-70 factor (ECF subfamily)